MSEILVDISVRWKNGPVIIRHTIDATQNHQWDTIDMPIVDRESQMLFYGYTFKPDVKLIPPKMFE